MSNTYRLPYKYGSRWIERTLAFGVAMAIALSWSLVTKVKLTKHGFEGLLYGIIGTYLIRALNVSAVTEGTLVMVVIVAIGVFLGLAAFGLGIAGWLLFSLLSTGLVLLVNFLFLRR